MNAKDASEYFRLITERWKELEARPGIFAYKLNIREKRYLPGKWGLFVELNEDRSNLRRVPQVINTLKPMFDESVFNFKKVDPGEHLLDINFEGKVISLIINKSPLTEYHILLCPDLSSGLPQIITGEAINFCSAFLMQLRDSNAIRFGYNSPGAMASVNNLHLHMVYIDFDLYIDLADLELLAEDYIYRLSKLMPTEAICFLMEANDNEEKRRTELKQLKDFLEWLCVANLPHNIFITPSRGPGSRHDCIKVFIFARERHCIIKDLTTLNIGFCELTGYLPVGSEDLFNKLTEDKVISKILSENGEAYKRIYRYFVENFKSSDN